MRLQMLQAHDARHHCRTILGLFSKSDAAKYVNSFGKFSLAFLINFIWAYIHYGKANTLTTIIFRTLTHLWYFVPRLAFLERKEMFRLRLDVAYTEAYLF